MARIELSNIGGGGGGGSTTLALTTTGTSGASVLTTVSGGYSLNIPVYQGALSLSTAGTSGASTLVGDTLTIPTYQGQISLTTTGTSGASTFVGNTLNIPTYQGAISLTTTGTSGAATLVGNTLNVPQYSTAPAGSTGQIQYNDAGAFAASANLVWDNTNVRLNVGAPSAPTGRLNIKGVGALTTVNTRLTNSGNIELLKVLDNGSTNIGTGFNWDNVNNKLGIGTSSPSEPLTVYGVGTSSSGRTWIRVQNAAPNLDGACGFQLYNADGNFAALQFSSSLWSAGPFMSVFTEQDIGIRFATNTGTSTGGNAQIEFRPGGFSEQVMMQVRRQGVNVGHTATTPGARLHVVGANTTAGAGAFLVQDGAGTPSTIYRIDNDGKVTYRATNTAAGTTGAQTINRPSGTVNFGIGASALVVTNSLCTTSSIVFATVRTNDATAYIKNVVPAAGSFTINLGANATAETSVGFFIIN